MEAHMTFNIFSLKTAILSLGLAAMASSVATAADRYAVIAVENTLSDATIGMSFVWGDGTWHKRSLRPGEKHQFCHQFAFPNENKNPPFHIKFDSSIAPGVYVESYHLKARAAPDCEFDRGHQYKFRYEVKGKFVELYDGH
jgi:hypothetical protein